MRLFALIFLVVYGLMNAYLFWKLHGALGPGVKLRIAVGLVLAALAAGPIVTMSLDRAGHFSWSAVLFPIAFCWLAVVFWFLALGLAGDLYNLLVYLGGLLSPGIRKALLPARPTMLVTSGLVVVLLVWGIIEAQWIRPQHVTLAAPQLPAGSRPIKVAVISDLHLGLYVGQSRLKRTIAVLQEEKPDVIISLGDFVDSPRGRLEEFVGPLSELRPPMGKYAVMGNHEFYVGAANSADFHRRTGFMLLRSESYAPAPGLRLCGVDDPAGSRAPLGGYTSELTNEDRILPPASAKREYVILLKHQPRVHQESLGRFDLQLSGHVHGGQLFPWHFMTRAVYPLWRGMYDLPEGSRLYVNRGTGTWGPPVRLGASPEVTIVTLVPPERK